MDSQSFVHTSKVSVPELDSSGGARLQQDGPKRGKKAFRCDQAAHGEGQHHCKLRGYVESAQAGRRRQVLRAQVQELQ